MQSQVDGNNDRLNRLKTLRDTLLFAIEDCDSKRDLAALSRQYRETLREIEEIEGPEVKNDGIGDILSARQADGDPTADRKNSSGL